MGNLERAAVLARSRGAKKPKFGETPSWWMTEEKIDAIRQKVFDINFIDRDDLDQKISNSKNRNTDALFMVGEGVSYKVAQIIALVGNQNISKYGIDKDKKYDNTEVILKLLENALDVYDIFCSCEKDFTKLEELEKHILVFAWKKNFLGEEISEDLEVSICPAEVAKCVTHYKNYEFQKFHDITDALIQEQLG